MLRLTPERVRLIRDCYAEGTLGSVRIARVHGVSPSTVLAVVKGRTWRRQGLDGQPLPGRPGRPRKPRARDSRQVTLEDVLGRPVEEVDLARWRGGQELARAAQ